MNQPYGIAVDAVGNLYISDTGANVIRKVSGGVITTFVGNLTRPNEFAFGPKGITLDTAGNLYIGAEDNHVYKVANGVITSVAGTDYGFACSYGGDNGPATSAQLCGPTSVALDAAGNLYIADSANMRVRMVSGGVITTVAGNGTAVESGDNGPATNAGVYPDGIALDPMGNLYIAESGDSLDNRIRKVSNGVITTIAGNGVPAYYGDNGPAVNAALSGPLGITADALGRIFVADSGNNRIRVLIPYCAYNISPSSIQSPISGGTFPITIQTDVSCSWQISGLPTWITLAIPLPNAGNATVVLMVAANFGTGRLANLIVASQPVTVTQGAAAGFEPAIALVANAAGESPIIGPNTWVEIKGSNLAPAGDTRNWQSSDFVNNQMPTALDSISITMNGESTYVDYIGLDQIDVLTPPDLAPGPVQVIVTVATVSSPPFASLAQPLSPSLFVFNGGPYVAAAHADGSLIGPASLYPGSTTPAKPGETIQLFGNGFGATNVPVVRGSVSQSGTLSPLPAITIGGVKAAVSFAGLVAPGEFQFNVAVPSGVANGDQSIIATYNGRTSQVGTLITIHN